MKQRCGRCKSTEWVRSYWRAGGLIHTERRCANCNWLLWLGKGRKMTKKEQLQYAQPTAAT